MKKSIVSIIIVCLCICFCVTAIGDEEKGIPEYHSAFGLSEGATLEEMKEAIEKTFSVTPYREDSNNYFPDKLLYDLPIRWISISADDYKEFSTRNIEIRFEDESLNAENIKMLYNTFCSEYGDPTVCNIYHDYITIHGNEKKPVSIEDLETIQFSIDHCSVEGVICWDNISLSFEAYILSDSSYKADKSKRFRIDCAFSENSLKPDVWNLYNDPKNQ